MGNSSDYPNIDFSASRPISEEPAVFIPPAPSYRLRREPMWRYIILFVLTVLSTTQAGGIHYASFIVAFSEQVPNFPLGSLLLHGLWYSLSILAILGCHELGHYFACRYYQVDASRPYFLPMPWQTCALRHRHRGTHRGFSGRGSRPADGNAHVDGCPSAGELSRRSVGAWRAAAVQGG